MYTVHAMAYFDTSREPVDPLQDVGVVLSGEEVQELGHSN